MNSALDTLWVLAERLDLHPYLEVECPRGIRTQDDTSVRDGMELSPNWFSSLSQELIFPWSSNTMWASSHGQVRSGCNVHQNQLVRVLVLDWELLEDRSRALFPHFPAPSKLSGLWKGLSSVWGIPPRQTTALRVIVWCYDEEGFFYSWRINMIMVIKEMNTIYWALSLCQVLGQALYRH